MPLVSCVECDHHISTEARACPSCGHPVDRPHRLALVWACRTLLAVTALYLFYNAFILSVVLAVPLLGSFWGARRGGPLPLSVFRRVSLLSAGPDFHGQVTDG